MTGATSLWQVVGGGGEGVRRGGGEGVVCMCMHFVFAYSGSDQT